MHFIKHLLRNSSLTSPPRLITRLLSTGSPTDDWNDAWETAWLPNDHSLSNEDRSPDLAPWESSSTPTPSTDLSADADEDTKAFVADMDERWAERRTAKKTAAQLVDQAAGKKGRDDYRLRKQRIHAGLWMKEIERMEEAKLGGRSAGDDIDRLMDSCSEIFDSGNIELNGAKIPGNPDFKTKPDGWESTSRSQDGNIWNITQREEDILLQEFERRIAFCKYQLASFIKTHIFSRRRPIDGWKYMIEVIGPNARRGKGSVQRLPGLTDPSIQPYKEDKPAIPPNFTSYRGT